MRRFAIGYALVVGLGMLGMWAVFFASGQVPEVRTAPIALAFHLAAEAATAVALIAAGVALARRTPSGARLYPVAIGMLLYTAMVSPGYFAQLGQWSFVGLFGGILGGALVALRGARG